MQPIEQVEKELNQLPILVIEGYIFDQTLSLSDFILKFIDTLNIRYQTTDNAGHTEATGKHRSLGDIYRVCRSYYPNVTLLEVYDAINTLWAECKIKTLKCPTISKRVYFEFAHHHSGASFKPKKGYFYANEYGWELANAEHYFNYKSSILTHE